MRQILALKGHIPAIGLIVLAAALSLCGLERELPLALWQRALTHPDFTDPRQLVALYSQLPRALTAILAGMALALAGVVFQQIARNPLAEPATLGTSAGAYLALTVGTVLFPGLFGVSRELTALAGGAAATLLVFALSWRRGLAPGALILAGLIVSFICGSVSSVLLLYANPYDLSLYLWGGGSLSQNDWSTVLTLLPRLACCAAALGVLARPLTLLGLDDAAARSIGLPVIWTRLAGLVIAVYLSVSVVCTVGIIGFIGLIAPAMARFAGARTLRQQIVYAPMIGAGLLWSTDQCLLLGTGGGREWLPAGAATALIGAPVLLAMLLRGSLPADPPGPGINMTARSRRPWAIVLGAVGLLTILAVIALDLGKGVGGWYWASPEQLDGLVAWRGPRATGAAAAGAMLALSGAILQRITGNDLASPEILGLGGGATLALVILALVAPAAGAGWQFAAMCGGAGAVTAALLALGRSTSFSSDRFLISGVAIAALTNAIVVAALATGAPPLQNLKLWMAGSTGQVSAGQALTGLALALAFLAVVPLLRRWLDLLPLGHAAARAAGLHAQRALFMLVLLAAALAAAATLIVGPLAFVGLMAPRLAAHWGIRQPTAQLFGAAAIGAVIMLAADWLGRTLLFPYEMPAGLMASLIGAPFFIWILWARKS